MTILDKGNFRLQNTVRVSVLAEKVFPEEIDVKQGLAVEKKCGDNNYYVICYVKWNLHEHCAEVEDVCMRLLDIEDNEWKLFKHLLVVAKEIVETANMEED